MTVWKKCVRIAQENDSFNPLTSCRNTKRALQSALLRYKAYVYKCVICLFSNSSNKAVLTWSRSFLAEDKMSRGMNFLIIQFIIQIDIWPTHIMSVVILLEEKCSALREIYTIMLFDWYIISSYLYSWSLQKQCSPTHICFLFWN